MSQVVEAFRKLLEAQKAIADETGNPKVVIATFWSMLEALELWYPLPDADVNSPHFDLDPDVIMETLKKLPHVAFAAANAIDADSVMQTKQVVEEVD
jgi:hypothetical protein